MKEVRTAIAKGLVMTRFSINILTATPLIVLARIIGGKEGLAAAEACERKIGNKILYRIEHLDKKLEKLAKKEGS